MPEREASARLRALYASYLEEAEAAEKNRKPGAGWFGTKGGPADDPCHDRFAESMRSYLEELSSGAPSDTIRDELAFIYAAPRKHPEPRAAYWMLVAVQGLTRPLVGRLTPQDAGELTELLEKSFRRSERVPVQVQLIRELRERARQ